jgi:hypothetical protein
MGALLVVVTSLVLGLGGCATMLIVGYRQGIAAIPQPLSLRYFAEIYHLGWRRLRPDTALTAVLAGAGLCATLNVALAMEHHTTDRRGLVAISAWRDGVDGVARLICLGAAGMSVVVWANLDSTQDVGTAVVTTLFAAITAKLTMSVRRQVNATDRSSRCAQAVRQLRVLDIWEHALKARGVPQPLGTSSKLSTYAVWWRPEMRRCQRHCAYRLLLVSGMGGAYGAVLIGAIMTIKLVEHAPVHLSCKLVALIVLVVLFVMLESAACAWLIIAATVLRRWVLPTIKWNRRRHRELISPDAVRWRLDVRPAVAHTLYFLSAAVAVALLQQYGVTVTIVASMYLGPLLLVPGIIWSTLRVSRQRSIARRPHKAAWPVWGLIELLLQQERHKAETVISECGRPDTEGQADEFRDNTPMAA